MSHSKAQQKLIRARNKLAKAHATLAGATDSKTIRNAKTSIMAHKRNIAHLSRTIGKPDEQLEAEIKRAKQAAREAIGYAKEARKKRQIFYKSRDWQELRYKVLRHYGRKCMCCGATPAMGAVMHVDHIVPISKAPDLALQFDNLQVLCEECNLGKSNTDQTDFRPVVKNEV